MKRSSLALIGTAFVCAAAPTANFAADQHDEPSNRALNLSAKKRNDPDALAAMIAARQRYFGAENVNEKNGKVANNKVIFSWFSVASFAVAARGRVFLMDSYIYRLADKRAYVPAIVQDLVDLNPEAIFLGHGHGDHSDNAAYVAKLTGATIYGAAEHCNAMQGDAGRMFGQGNTVKCTSITPLGEAIGAQVRTVNALQGDLCVSAFKHLHSGNAPLDTTLPQNLVNAVRDPRVDTLFPPNPAPTLDTRTQAGAGGAISIFYQFTVAGSDFTFSWHDTAGPIKDFAPQIIPILANLPKTDVEIGSGVSLGETINGVRDITQYISLIQPKVFYMMHSDNFNIGASMYYLNAINRQFDNIKLPTADRPSIRGLHDPYDYVRPGLMTFDWKDEYWRGSTIGNRFSKNCPG